MLYDEGQFSPLGFIHVACAKDYFETADILEQVLHFSPALSDAEREELRGALTVGLGASSRIPDDRFPGGDISGHHTPRSDHRAIADRHSGQDDRAAADPHVATDRHRPAQFEAVAAKLRIARMVRGIDLHGRADLSAIADRDGDDVQEHAVVIEENTVTETDVVAVVAEERRPY